MLLILINMFKLVKLHLSYIINKNNLIVIGIGIIIFLIVCMFLSNFYKSADLQILYSIEYQNNYDFFVINFSKIFFTLLSCYVFSYSFIKNSDYRIILNTKISKFFITKMISVVFIIFISVLSFYLIYLSVGLLTYFFIFKIEMLLYFVRLFIFSITLGLISLMFSLIFYNVFPFLIVYLLFAFLENFSNYEFINYLFVFFPNILIFNNSNNFEIVIVLFQFIFYLFLDYLLFYKIEYFNS